MSTHHDYFNDLAMKVPFGHQFGQTLRACSVGDFALTETLYAPNAELPKHSHEAAYFCLVLQGTYVEAYDKQSRVCQPLTLIFHPAEEVHSDRFQDAGGRCFNVQVKQGWLARVREHSALFDSSTHFYGGLTTTLGMSLYREFCQIDEASPLAIEGLALEIVASASRQSKNGSLGIRQRWLDQTRQIIQERFTEHLSLAEIAEWVGVHPVHLAREFRKRYQLTIGEYVRQLRVDFVCRELSRSSASLTEVALKAGFSHQGHLSRTFKRITGMTPAEYRRLERFANSVQESFSREIHKRR